MPQLLPARWVATLAVALLALAVPASAQGTWTDSFAVPGTYEGGVYSAAVNAVASDGAGALVGGEFRQIDGVKASGVARRTGGAWETFGGPLPYPGLPSNVLALARWNGLLVVGGTFSEVAQPSGETLDARAVAAWDGTAWRALPGLDSNVDGLAAVDGKLFATNGLGQRAARWTGTTWTPLGLNPPAGAVEIAGAGRSLYFGGGFETAGGIPSPALARFDLDGIVATEAPTAPDALGRTVAVLLDGEAGAGEQTLRADVSRLPASTPRASRRARLFRRSG